ncbi:Uncharacterised protein [Mycobacteroides abscessus subsp. abscessus]|nr:Uncharacterised protein [Mycobacteroides abscessus subsp. abscessus]
MLPDGGDIIEVETQGRRKLHDGTERGRREPTGLDLPQRLRRDPRSARHLIKRAVGAGGAQQSAQTLARSELCGGERLTDHGADSSLGI